MSMSKMRDYKYIYICIPTINGEISGEPKLYFSNILEDNFLELLDLFNLPEATIYVINTKSLYIKELK